MQRQRTSSDFLAPVNFCSFLNLAYTQFSLSLQLPVDSYLLAESLPDLEWN